MNVIGISGLHDSVAFKRKEFPKLTRREYRIAQGFDSAAVLVNSSGIVAAAAEERFTGEKATGVFPIHAIQYCLEVAKLSHRDVDYAAHGFAYDPVKSFFDQDEYTQRQYAEVFSPEVQIRHLAEHFTAPNWREKFIPIPHHLAHAASAFYPSGFEEALILVSDGMGEVHSMSVAIGNRHDVRIIKQIPALYSLGTLYGVFTLHLGFYMGLDEYKVMGLAPYGNPRRYYDKILECIRLKNDGTYAMPIFAHDQSLEERETHAGVLRFLADQFGPAREPESEINQDHKDIAAALQAVLQTCQLHVLRHFKRETGQSNLCLAGGVALNCSANGVIKRSRLFQQMFIQPAAGDDGTALGAALYAQRLQDPDFTTHRMSVPLWGPEFREEEIQEALAGRSDCQWIKAESIDKLCRETAARIDKGQIIAWYQGRMEFGPRSLGARSILADPRDPTMRDRINASVKKREGFRPFAPAVLENRVGQHFELDHPSRFMLETCNVCSKLNLPAITHVDGSARVQTVDADTNPRFS